MKPVENEDRYITVLSIDGGGVKGLLPAVILEFLESQLQKLDGEEARIADYFDVIAGTSTGGLVTAMITTPDRNNHNRPLYAAKDIKPFYLENCPKIFPQLHKNCPLGKLVKSLIGPLYDGKHLREILRKKLGDVRLSETLTDVIIPAYDIQHMQPVIFSTYEARKQKGLDAKMTDICISTSAAPTYLPGHKFSTTDEHGNEREFNLIDGGVAANNPAFLAISQATKKMFDNKTTDFFRTKPVDYPRLLTLSIGTGSGSAAIDGTMKYNSTIAGKWGILDWLLHKGTSPLIEIFMQAGSDMVDIHTSLIFQSLYSEDNYLRIQDDELKGDENLVDIATEENLKKLVEIGERMLKNPVSRVNLGTGITEQCKTKRGFSNEDALISFAHSLSNERKIREVERKRSVAEKKLKIGSVKKMTKVQSVLSFTNRFIYYPIYSPKVVGPFTK